MALRLGRLDEETTANVGSVSGGVGGTNVVPEHAWFFAETRSFDPAKVEAVVAEIVVHCHDAPGVPLREIGHCNRGHGAMV